MRRAWSILSKQPKPPARWPDNWASYCSGPSFSQNSSQPSAVSKPLYASCDGTKQDTVSYKVNLKVPLYLTPRPQYLSALGERLGSGTEEELLSVSCPAIPRIRVQVVSHRLRTVTKVAVQYTPMSLHLRMTRRLTWLTPGNVTVTQCHPPSDWPSSSFLLCFPVFGLLNSAFKRDQHNLRQSLQNGPYSMSH
jgi:hypothetical protein